MTKRPPRAPQTALGKRPLQDRPPVLTPAELAVLGPDDLDELARGRRKPAGRRTPSRRSTASAPARRTAKPSEKGAGTTARSATPRRRRAAGGDTAS